MFVKQDKMEVVQLLLEPGLHHELSRIRDFMSSRAEEFHFD